VKAPRLNWKEDPAHPVPAGRQQAFERFSDAMELPLLILALAMIPLIILPLLTDLPDDLDAAFAVADLAIWAVFAVDYVVKLALAPRRWYFVTHNVLDLVIVIVPFLRPLRILRSARAIRLARLTRLGAFAGTGAKKSRKALHVRGVGYIVVITVALVTVLSAVVYDLEHNARGTNIKTYPDAVWWAASTASTVGYGDKFPVTAAGRLAALVLMVSGIALLGVITASLATVFVNRSRAEKEKEQSEAVDDDRLGQILDRLTAIESSIATLQGHTGPALLRSGHTDGADQTMAPDRSSLSADEYPSHIDHDKEGARNVNDTRRREEARSPGQ
jgi:voltage-gated potassium channel